VSTPAKPARSIASAPRPALGEIAERLLSPEDVARRCGLSRRAVYRAIERGELPAARLCSRLRIQPGDVEAWIAANQVEVAALPEVADFPRRRGPVATNGLRRLVAQSSPAEAARQ
jgi:excisionase family DNA binding protein